MRWLGFILPLVIAATAPASAGIDPDDIGDSSCARKVRAGALEDSPLSITLWNYFGRSFDHAGVLQLRRREANRGYYRLNSGEGDSSGRFRLCPNSQNLNLRRGRPFFLINPVECEASSQSIGATLADRNQHFPLQVMVDSKYITQRLREAQAGFGDRLSPDQLLFIEATSERSAEELRRTFGEIPSFARLEPMAKSVADYFAQFEGFDDIYANPKYQLKEGSVQLISGQPLGVAHKLYLEQDNLARPIDRTTYRYIWEMSRAARISPQAFTETLKVGLYYVVRELVLLGGSIDEAFLFGHSLNQRIGSIYRRFYQMDDYSDYDGSPTEKAHLRPLRKALAAIDISGVNPTVGEWIEASNGTLAPFDAIRWFLSLQQNRTEYLSDEMETEVVQIRDFSPLANFIFERETGRKDLSPAMEPKGEYRDTIVEYALNDSESYRMPVQGNRMPRQDVFTQQFYDGLEYLDEFLWRTKAIEVTSRSASLEPHELLRIAYENAIHKLIAVGVKNPHRVLEDLKVNFVLIDNSVPDLAASGRWYVFREKIQSVASAMDFHFFGAATRVLSNEISLNATAYAPSAIVKTAKSSRYFRRGKAHLRKYLTSPDLMSF